jgi:hypothetical protein
MSTGLKVVLWIVGIIAGLFALLVIGGYFLGRSMVGDIDDGKSFAKNATHEECVEEFAKRTRACDGMKCMIGVSGFVGGCLADAKGDLKQFCAAVPPMGDRAAAKSWGDEFCSKHDIAGDANKCNMATTAIVSSCSAAVGRR